MGQKAVFLLSSILSSFAFVHERRCIFLHGLSVIRAYRIVVQ